jgi:hypothetical protein
VLHNGERSNGRNTCAGSEKYGSLGTVASSVATLRHVFDIYNFNTLDIDPPLRQLTTRFAWLCSPSWSLPRQSVVCRSRWGYKVLAFYAKPAGGTWSAESLLCRAPAMTTDNWRDPLGGHDARRRTNDKAAHALVRSRTSAFDARLCEGDRRDCRAGNGCGACQTDVSLTFAFPPARGGVPILS